MAGINFTFFLAAMEKRYQAEKALAETHTAKILAKKKNSFDMDRDEKITQASKACQDARDVFLRACDEVDELLPLPAQKDIVDYLYGVAYKKAQQTPAESFQTHLKQTITDGAESPNRMFFNFLLTRDPAGSALIGVSTIMPTFISIAGTVILAALGIAALFTFPFILIPIVAVLMLTGIIVGAIYGPRPFRETLKQLQEGVEADSKTPPVSDALTEQKPIETHYRHSPTATTNPQDKDKDKLIRPIQPK